jgi:hypothetical protein
MRSLLPIFLAASLAVTAGCRKHDAKPGTTETTSAAATATATSESAKPASDRSRLHELESKAGYGQTWGADAKSQKLAKAVADVLVKDMAVTRSELAVAVMANDKTCVAVIKMKYLKDEGREDRKDYANEIHAALAEGLPDGTDVVFGIRGKLLYGTVAWGKAGGELDMKVGTSVPPDRLVTALATM